MPKLPQISGRQMGRVLVRLGFRFKSQKGSHIKFVRERHEDEEEEVIIIPNHRVLRKGTLHDILKKVDVRATGDLKKLMK